MSKISFVGQKIGMSSIFINNKIVPVTIVEILPHTILDIRTNEKHGYNALVVAGGKMVKDKKINKPQIKMFHSISAAPRSDVYEYRLSKDEIPATELIGTEFKLYNELLNAKVITRSKSKGKGFQGGMKRWGFDGLNASHGVSVSHRSIGSTGNRTLPGRVFKGKKMPGRMGGDFITMKNNKIVFVSLDKSYIAISGSIPGHPGSTISVTNGLIQEESNILNNVKYA